MLIIVRQRLLAADSSPVKAQGWCFDRDIEIDCDGIGVGVLAHLRRFATFAAEFFLLHAHRIRTPLQSQRAGRCQQV